MFSDDSDVDCVSLTSTDPEDNDVEFIGNSLGGEATTTRLVDVEYVGQSSRDSSQRTHTSAVINGYSKNRKRLSNRADDEVCEELPRKMMRTDISETSSWQVGNDVHRDCSIHEQKADTHIILFRLPDGSRVQKQFLSSSPVKVCTATSVVVTLPSQGH